MTPAEEKEAAARDKQKKDLSNKKAALKKQANDIDNFGIKMAAKIPAAGGMTTSDFKNKWIPGFEQGYVNLTPDAKDTPYDQPYSNRPKIRIISEGK